ncbi:ATP-binding protein [Gracilibacillus marinus]|jgi:two-component system, sporulation sensor kinase A|uniref:histidine kinase n=1 Tax=Gracilibacillus marinus TaxID=630535 RepID=A0ABV8VSY2_9BACI
MNHIKYSTKKTSDIQECHLADLPKDIIQTIDSINYDLITLSDFSGAITFVSDSVERVLGYTTKELLGKSIYRYMMQDDKKYIQDNFDKNALANQKFYLHIRHNSGKFIIFETNAIIINKDSNKTQILSVSKDISDKKQAEEMIIRSEKMSIAGQLAAGIAHEIRNPLTSLRGFIQLLQAGLENKQEYYKIMMDEIEKINTITSELLFISKPMTDEKTDEKVSEMLNDVIILLSTHASLFKIELQLQIREDMHIHCDRSQLKQVFINLIKNAIEEMSDGGIIQTIVERQNNCCVISIIDQGPGIPKHLIHKLKEPFFTTKKNGTGLGLMISNQIIENHHGYLEIKSEKNIGSTFSIYIPLN